MAGTIKYDKLLKLMEEKGLSTYKIRKEKIISESTLQNIRNNGRITTDAIANLCEALNCQPGDILEYIPDTPDETVQADNWTYTKKPKLINSFRLFYKVNFSIL